MTTSTTPSRRAAQRLAQQIAHQQAMQPRLPEDLESMLTGYRVHGVSDADWDVARPVLLEVMRRSHVRGKDSFRKHLGVVARYLVHRVKIGLSVDIEAAFSAVQIDHYYLHGLSVPSARTRNDYRSRLLNIAEHVAVGIGAPVTAPTLGHRSVRPGYTTVEEAQIRRVALRQRSDLRRRQMCAIVGLTIGAGLGPGDLRSLCVDDIVDHGTDGVEVRVPGPEARTTWVRRDYEAFVRAGIDGLAAGDLVIGEQIDRRNITTGVFARVDNYDGPALDAFRMRSTWLSWLMTRRVPIQVILQASGLKGARTLTELVEYLDDVVAADDDAMLRGDV